MNQSQLNRGKAIHRQTGQTFYYATRLLPARIREQTYVLYGFFRIADEVVDDGADLSPAEQHRRLDELRAAALGERAAEDPVIAAFAELRDREGIPAAEVESFIDAMRSDIDTQSYDTYADLETYMRGSAAAVGNMMTVIMDADFEQARPHAMALGEAFQLTNFIRDVREDIRELDRVYLPKETLTYHDVSIDDIRAEDPSVGFRNAVQSELRRAERRYREGIAGVEYLPRDCQFPVLLSAVLYAEHHRFIRKQDFDVLSARPSLSRSRKLLTTARTWWHWKRLSDPVAVFQRVSAVPTTDVWQEERSDERERGIPTSG